MGVQGLADLVLEDKVLAAAVEDARTGAVPALDLTGPPALRPFVVRGLVDAGRTVLAVAATAREAEDLVEALGSLMDPALVGYYPSWETLPHERLSPRSDTVGRRLAVLRRLAHPGDDPSNGPLKVVVAPVRSVLQPQVKGLADLEPVELTVGAEADLEDVVRRLSAAAYTRVDLVEKRGEFAVRGGIVDVFPPTEEHPLRVEFWGDEVEEIRSFAVADQRTLEPAARLWAPPCRELLLTDEVRARARRLGEQHPQLREITEKLAEGHAVEGMESLAPVLVDDMEMLIDLMPEDTHVLVLDPERARSRAHDLVATSEEFLEASWAAAAGGGQAPIDLGAASYHSLGDVRALSLAQGKPWWSVSPFGIADEGGGGFETLASLAPQPPDGALAPQPAGGAAAGQPGGDRSASSTDRRRGRRGRDAGGAAASGGGVPRRHRGRGRGHEALARRRQSRGPGQRGPRARAPDGRGAQGARRAGALRRGARDRRGRAPRPGRGDHGLPHARAGR